MLSHCRLHLGHLCFSLPCPVRTAFSPLNAHHRDPAMAPSLILCVGPYSDDHRWQDSLAVALNSAFSPQLLCFSFLCLSLIPKCPCFSTAAGVSSGTAPTEPGTESPRSLGQRLQSRDRNFHMDSPLSFLPGLSSELSFYNHYERTGFQS